MVKISFDPEKRKWTLENRGFDFCDVAKVFEGPVYEFEDTRKDYGAKRVICFGYLDDILVSFGYVQRGDTKHIFTMRKANAKEKKGFQKRLC